MPRIPWLRAALILLISLALAGAGLAGASPAGAVRRDAAIHHHKRHHRSHKKNHRAKLVKPSSAFCANADLQPAPANFGLIRDATLCLINQVRGQHGLGALAANATLEQIAQPYALRLVGENFFGHVTPDGQTPLARFLLSGYFPNLPNVQHRYGENLGWGTLDHASPAMLVSTWVHSPVHLANILNAGFRESGIGVVMGLPAVLGAGPAGVTYVQEFGATH
ncbi:MAG: CAP domain-containing protein [Actinobacteria bacterium]|nr:CAP domain-containing protein [Actinomycetota bacterium]